MSVTRQPTTLAKIEQKTVIDLLVQGKRMDGRGLMDFREMILEPGIIPKANGSAQIRLGKTKVMVGIKIQTGFPFPDTPNDGILTVNAELLPLASPTFEPGPPDENSIELARVVDRGIRESKAIGLDKLCIDPGKKVFMIFVDIYVLDHDGNLINAAGIAALTALLNAKMKEYEVKDGEVIYKEHQIPLPMQNYPVPITIAKIGGKMVLDPCFEEELVMSSRLTVTIDKDDHLCAMQKGGLGEITIEEAKQAVSTAVTKSRELRERVMREVANA